MAATPSFASEDREELTGGVVNPAIAAAASEIRRRFVQAAPFRHVCIDNFLTQAAAERLAAAASRAAPGGETPLPLVDATGAELYRYIASAGFVELMSQLTGEDDLVAQEEFFEASLIDRPGGTVPHLDQAAASRGVTVRRLKLLLFLGPRAGTLDVYANPEMPPQASFESRVNRAVIHEVSSRSWTAMRAAAAGGGDAGAAHVVVYLRALVAEAAAAPEGPGTGIVIPLPTHLAPGHHLSPADLTQLTRAVGQRDALIRVYNDQQARLQLRLAETRRALERATRVRLLGYGVEDGNRAGFHHDGWVAPAARLTLSGRKPISRVLVRGWVHERLPAGGRLSVAAGATVGGNVALDPGTIELGIDLPEPTTGPVELSFSSDVTMPSEGEDRRRISFILKEIELVHPAEAAPDPEPQPPPTASEPPWSEQIAGLQAELVAALREALALRATLGERDQALSRGEAAATAVQSDLAALRQVLAAREAALAEAAAQADRTAAELAATREALVARDKALARAQRGAAGHAAAAAAAQEDIAALRERLAAREAALAEASQRAATETAAARAERAAREAALARAAEEIAANEAATGAARAELAAARAALAARDAALARAEQSAAEQQAAAGAARAELARLAETVHAAEAALDASMQRAEAAARAIAAGEAEAAALFELLAEYGSVVAAAGDRVAQTAAELARAEQLADERGAALARMRVDLVSAQAELALRRSLAASRKTEAEERLTALAAARAEIDRLKAGLDETEEPQARAAGA